jgi:lysophospholipase L1-like esterase
MPLALDTLALAVLAPLLAVQARHVRRKALILPEAKGARHSTGGRDAPLLDLLILGDSSAAGVGVARQEAALSGQLIRLLAQHRPIAWRLEARTGVSTASILHHLQRHPPLQAETVLVVLGVNDITKLTPLRRLLRQRAALYRLLKTQAGAQRILVTGLPPMGRFPLLPQPLRWVIGRRAARFDAALARQAEALGCVYMRQAIPFAPELMAADGFHPGPAAYQLWAKAIAARMVQPPP